MEKRGFNGILMTGFLVMLAYFIIKFLVKAAFKGIEFILFAGIVIILVGIFKTVKSNS